MKKILLIFILLSSVYARGQNVLSIYNMRHLPQVVYANPAFVPLARVNISAPFFGSIYTQLGKSNFTTDVTSTDASGNFVFDAPKFINGLEAENSIYSTKSFESLNIGLTAGKNYFFLTSNDKITGNLNFPKEVGLIITEVQQEVGFNNPVDINNLSVNYMHYREFGFGWSRKINRKITIGANLKYLSGVITAQSAINGQFKPGLDSNDIEGLVNVEILTAGVDNYRDDIQKIKTFEDFIKSPFFGLTGLKNNGYSLDMGVDYRINKKLKMAVSVVDLFAHINWSDSINNYLANDVAVNFNSFDAEDFIDLSTQDTLLLNFLDSIASSTEPNQNNNNFTTSIPTKILGSVTYYIFPKIEATILGQMEFTSDEFQPYLRIGIQGRFKRFINYSLSYSLIDPRASVKNLGIGLAVNIGPVQVYGLTDNILDPLLFNSPNKPGLRFGLNFTFGRDYE